jgi:hypothetical protein
MSFWHFGVVFSFFLKSFGWAYQQAEVPGWAFAPEFAIRLPEGWKVLGRSEKQGIGYEMFIGLDGRTNLRLFYSGHELSKDEFRSRMQKVIAAEPKAPLRAEILDWGRDGLRLHLERRARYKGAEVIEIISPLVAASRGLDMHLVAPWRDRKKAQAWHSELLASLKLYWTDNAMPKEHGAKPSKPQGP